MSSIDATAMREAYRSGVLKGLGIVLDIGKDDHEEQERFEAVGIQSAGSVAR